jgi:hypothetical protein
LYDIIFIRSSSSSLALSCFSKGKFDLLIESLQVVAIISAIFLAIGIKYGIGTHEAQLTSDQIVAATKWSWMNQTVGIFAIGTGKLALVAFLQQIHGPDHRGRVAFLWGVAISNLILNCITIGMIMTQCSPRGKLWNGDIAGTCDGRIRNQNMAYFQGSQYYSRGPRYCCDFIANISRYLQAGPRYAI